MKKFLVYGVLFSILIQPIVYSFDSIGEVRDYFFADEIEKAAKNFNSPKVDSVTTSIIKKEKVNKLKKQLVIKQEELAEIKADSNVGFIKKYRKKRIESKIEDIKNQIKELENT